LLSNDIAYDIVHDIIWFDLEGYKEDFFTWNSFNLLISSISLKANK